MPYQLFIAWRYLQSRRNQKILSIIGGIAVLGITVGVWALVSVLAFQSGMEEELRNKILSGTAHVNLLRKNNLPLENPEELIQKIKQINYVKTAAATTYQTVLISSTDHSAMGILKAVDPTAPTESIEVYQIILPGGNIHHLTRTLYDDGVEIEGIILGKRLAEDLNVRVNDVVEVITSSSEGHLTPMGILPRSYQLKVVGLCESGLYEYDSAWGYISMETSQAMSGQSQASVIQINLTDIYKAKTVGAEVKKIAGSEYLINDWQELNQSAFAALNLQRLGFVVGISLIILVASLNIITTLILLVAEKKRDIAILTAMGASSRDILSIFMLQGLIIGLCGTILGGIAGIGTAWFGDKYQLIQLDPRIYSISYVPFRIAFLDTLLILAIALGISFIATLYPAWQASNLDPVKGIRQS